MPGSVVKGQSIKMQSFGNSYSGLDLPPRYTNDLRLVSGKHRRNQNNYIWAFAVCKSGSSKSFYLYSSPVAVQVAKEPTALANCYWCQMTLLLQLQ